MALLTDKVVLVSGGTQGVGAGVAQAAAREGAAVAVTGRRREPGEALAAELQAAGATARFVQADVADVAQAQGSVATVVAELGRVDCLVNAAGLTARGTLLDTTPELFDAYVAAKAGLAGLTRNAAHAHRWDRIRINGLDIGWTETEGEDATQRTFHEADDTWRERAARALPMGKLGQVHEIADFVVFLLSDRSGVVTGSVIDWDQNVFGGLD